MNSMLDSLAQKQEGMTPCPQCASLIPPGAMLCTNCGYNVSTGKKLHAPKVVVEKGPSKIAGAAKVAGGAASATMWPLFALLFAVVGGAVGAGLWFAVATSAGVSLKILVIVIGLLAGLGAKLGAGDRAGALSGGIAVVVTIVAMVASFMTFVEADTQGVADKVKSGKMQLYTRDDDVPVGYYASELAFNMADRGASLDWPEGMGPQTAQWSYDFPSDLWQDAQSGWERMTDEEQDMYVARANEGIRAHLAAGGELEITEDGMFAYLDVRDFIFLGIAVVASLWVGSGGDIKDWFNRE